MNKLNHIAIIMDGNGRWGLKKKGSRNYGHLKGLKAVENSNQINHLSKKNILHLTLVHIFNRKLEKTRSEINFLFDLIRKSSKKKSKKINTKQGMSKLTLLGKKKDYQVI